MDSRWISFFTSSKKNLHSSMHILRNKCVSLLGCGGVDSRMMAIKTEFSFTFVSLENNIPALVSPLIFEVLLFIQSHFMIMWWLCKLAGGFYRLYISFQFQTTNSTWFLGLLLFWSLAFFKDFLLYNSVVT